MKQVRRNGKRTGPSAGFADQLRETTRTLHARAERTGIIRKILSGHVSRRAYALYLRNLLPAYEQLEKSLVYHRRAPGVRLIANSAVYRSEAIASDLLYLCGSGWHDDLPLLPSGRIYRRRVVQAADGRGEALIAHAYTRYLGDLNGGQVIRRQLTRSLDVGPGGLSFYEFPAVSDLAAMRSGYRAAIDRSADEISGHQDVLQEAVMAFDLNIAVSAAVDQVVAGETESHHA